MLRPFLALLLVLALPFGARAAVATEPVVEIAELDAWGPGDGAPVEGGEVRASALVRVGDYAGTLLVEWRLLQQGRTCGGLVTLEVEPGDEAPVACTFPPAPSDAPRLSDADDAVVLTVSDGGALVETARAPFTWEIVGSIAEAAPPPSPGATALALGGPKKRDRIRTAAIASAPGERPTAGDSLIVQVVSATAPGLAGSRTLELYGRGRQLLEAQSFDSPGGETLTTSFAVGTHALGAGRHRFKVVLTDPNGRRHRKIASTRLAAAPPPPPEMPAPSPLPDVECLDELVTLSLLHDGSEGADLIEIAIDGEILPAPFDLYACGADEGDPCTAVAEIPLRPGERASVAIHVIEDGGGPTESSALELWGQCSPETVSWPMGSGESASFWVSRPPGAGELPPAPILPGPPDVVPLPGPPADLPDEGV